MDIKLDYSDVSFKDNGKLIICDAKNNLGNNLFKNKVVLEISSLLKSDLETALNEAQKVGAESCSYAGARGMMQQ